MASVQERLRAAMEGPLSEPIRLPFPSSTDGSLVVRYKPVKDWAQVQAFARTDDPVKELEAAADTLLSACEGCEAHIDGDVIELPHKLGAALAADLGWETTGLTDRQALFLICPNTIKLIKHHDDLLRASEATTEKAEAVAEGESPAS